MLTGAAGGIGRATARRLAAAGAHLALVDRDAPRLDALAVELRENGGGRRVSTHVFDLAALAELRTLASSIAADHGAVHGLICNAALTVHKRFAAHTVDELDRVLDVDLRSVVHTVHAFLPHLRDVTAGHVVIVSSMAGVNAFPYQSVYSTAKFALRGFGEVLRIELAAEGIGVSTIFPGAIATGFLEGVPSSEPEMVEKLSVLMRRYGTSSDRVARAIVRAIRRNRGVSRVGWDSRLTSALTRLAPPLMPAVLRFAYRRRMMGSG